MSAQSAKTVVIPAAGLGTRSLPATKVVPKELLPVLDIPAIQLMVEEAVRSGFERVVLVLREGKQLVADHFERHPELEEYLEARGQAELLEKVTAVCKLAEVVVARQPEPLGLGHAVLCAREAVGRKPFSVLLPDDLVISPTPPLGQVADAVRSDEEGAVALMEVPEGRQHLYGIARVDSDRWREGAPVAIEQLVEKPAPGSAPSCLAVVGRYVLPNEVFDSLDKVKRGAGGEIQLTDGLERLVRQGTTVRGVVLKGTRFDLGDPAGYVAATVHAALARQGLEPRVRRLVGELLTSS